MKEAIFYFLSFKSYVVLPVIILILAIVFHIQLTTAIKSALTVGIGFVGIFMTFDYFVKVINPVVQALVARTGLHLNVLDAGWPPLAAITWKFEMAPLLLVIIMGVNLLLLIFKFTKTVDIDIWNYWHIIFTAAIVYQVTENTFLTIGISILVFVMVLKLADWTAPLVNKFAGMQGICIPHLSGIVYYPFALLANEVMEHIPGFNKIDAKPEKIQEKFGLLGEPMILGLLMGVGLGIGAGYSVKDISELAVNFAAVIFILPKMCAILGTSLLPISEGMKVFIAKKFPKMGATYIGLDVAILFGMPSVVVTSLLLIPVSLGAAFVLPGISFIPLGELTNIVVPMAFIAVATKGNVIRSFIIGVPMVIVNLYVASSMATFLTEMAKRTNYQIAGYEGTFTSFLDGGNYFRAWVAQMVSMNGLALAMLPVAAVVLFFTWKITKREAGLLENKVK